MKNRLTYLFLFFCFFLTWTETRSIFVDNIKFRCDYTYCRNCKGWMKYHTIPATFENARLRCDLEGAILASPTTPQLKAVMMQTISNSDILTGIHATFSEGDFTTIDGIPLAKIPHNWAKKSRKYSIFSTGLSDFGNCTILNSKGLLDDVSCDTKLPFMCFRGKIEEINACGTPDNEYHMDNKTQTCYKFHVVPKTFSKAQMACSAEGGHLAIINSEAEAEIMRNLFIRHPPEMVIGNFPKNVAFIGITDWNQHGDLRTIHGQTLSDAGYDKFAPNEPNNSTTTEFCGAVDSSGLLYDVKCDDYYPFICEKKPEFPPVCGMF
ncbi:C-type mannose receptor 2-like [Anticarsia gemmatalis]|uniref:C-type mannose receptor 2-like n=1 Tax=Anticarsia gemmatalis TaxID=129554 RepID=UPI003F75B5BE